MEMTFLALVVLFFALVGVTNLVLGLRRWLAHSGSLGRAMLVLELSPEDPAAEAKLVQAAETLRLTPGMEGVELGVICPGGAAYALCQSYTHKQPLRLCHSWNELTETTR